MRVFCAHNLHYLSDLPKPHYLGIDLAAEETQRYKDLSDSWWRRLGGKQAGTRLCRRLVL